MSSDYEDYRESLKFIMDEEIDTENWDDHCACVPILKRRVKELESRIKELEDEVDEFCGR